MKLTCAIDIAAPSVRVFDIVANSVGRQLSTGGQTDTGGICDLDAENPPGTTVRCRVRRGGRVLEYEGQVTAYEKPNHLAVRVSHSAYSIHTDYRFAPASPTEPPSGSAPTRLNCVCELTFANWFYSLMGTLFHRLMERRLYRQMQLIKMGAESYSSSPQLPQMKAGLRDLWSVPRSHYKGLMSYCAPGTHEAALAVLLQHVQPRGNVLDLAAGSGAWLGRLRDAGFKDLCAVELNVDWFELEGLTPRPIDLNTTFSQEFDSPFGLVTAIEIMEHLDCPRDFLRQIHHLLRDDGYLLLTTPNIGHWIGRLRFLKRGEHRYFREGDYHSQRHISAMTDLHVRLMLRETGFRLVESRVAGSFFGPLRKLVTMPLSIPFRILFGSRTGGDISIYLAAKSKPDTTSAGRDSHYLSRLIEDKTF